jgi:hypothetical protein
VVDIFYLIRNDLAMKTIDLKKLNNLLVVSKESLESFENDKNRLNFNIKYWVKNGELISIKRGFYVLRSVWEREVNKDLFLEYLANKLIEPSYLSFEYVLSKYSLLSESVYVITSATSKSTKTISSSMGVFNYYSLSSDLFTGYLVKDFSSVTILEATKAKAMFDFLYIRFLKKAIINKGVIEELRINWENFKKKDFLEMKIYSKIARSRRVKEVIKLIEEMYYAK